ncbi:receptor-type guanylate cyclase gcy-28-like [Homarus americanus]|uniref:receptor-type guanylate cyclase gcy-28-like n=1 Tax=Homarus americanus TaxID=6706 RepID=UPI001C4693F6|nr:receptor-type guanylate cyclase gcy-28-like [Homarus americanus]
MNPHTGVFESVATYYGESESLEFTGNISWPGGRPPRDQPVCGFDMSLCPETHGPWSIVAGLLALLVVVMAVGSVFIYRHYKLEADLASMTWRISWEDVEITEKTKRGKCGSKISIGKMSVNTYTSVDSLVDNRQVFIRTATGWRSALSELRTHGNLKSSIRGGLACTQLTDFDSTA